MKVAIVNYDDLSVWLFRRGLIKELIAMGHTVHILCAYGPYVERLKAMGAIFVPINIPRFITPARDMMGLFCLYRIFNRFRYDIVHLFQIKLIVYGAIAAKMAGMKRLFASCTGTGILTNAFIDWKKVQLQRISKMLYAFSMPLIDRILFQNEADRDFFCLRGLVKPERAVVVRGSGVNTEEYSERALDLSTVQLLRSRIPGISERVVVTMVGRVVETKGVREFIEASKVLEAKEPGLALFLLFGDVEPDNPESFCPGYVRSQESEVFRWMGWTDNVPEVFSISDIAVLPSYREGTPRALLEAMAMAKPIVTTDAPGCRNVIEHDRNGFMVPVRDHIELAKAIQVLAEDAELRRKFGKRSYEKVLEEFEEHLIVRQIIRELYGLDPR